MLNISKKNSFVNYIVPLLLITVNFFWKLYFINSRDICIDEPFTIFHAQGSVSQIIKLTSGGEMNPPLFTLIIHFWIKLFGISPLSVRMVPLLFNCLTIAFIYNIGKKFFTPLVGFASSALFMFSTFHFYFGLETRVYSMISFATASSLYFFLSLRTTNRTKVIFICLLLSNLLLVYGHYIGWFIILTELLLSFLYLKNFKTLKLILLNLLLVVILYLPMWPVIYKQFLKVSDAGIGLSAPALKDYKFMIMQSLNDIVVYWFCLIIIFLRLVFLLINHFIKQPDKIKKEFIIIFLWFLIPYTMMYIISKKASLFFTPYILFNTIGLYLLVGICMIGHYEKINWIKYILVTGLLIISFIFMRINAKDFFYREIRNSVTRVMEKKNNHTVIVIHPHWADLGFLYYYNRSIFRHYNDLDKEEVKNKILAAWNFYILKDTLRNYKNYDIIYYQDGSLGDDPKNRIYKLLDSFYVKQDSAFFPECLYVSYFKFKKLLPVNSKAIHYKD